MKGHRAWVKMRVSRVPGVIVVQIYWSFKTIMLNLDVTTELFIVLLSVHSVPAAGARCSHWWCAVFPLWCAVFPPLVHGAPAPKGGF